MLDAVPTSSNGVPTSGKKPARLMQFVNKEHKRLMEVDWEDNRKLADSVAFDELSDPVMFRDRHQYDAYLEDTLRPTRVAHANYSRTFQDRTVIPTMFEPLGSPADWTAHTPHIQNVLERNSTAVKKIDHLSSSANPAALHKLICAKQQQLNSRGFLPSHGKEEHTRAILRRIRAGSTANRTNPIKTEINNSTVETNEHHSEKKDDDDVSSELQETHYDAGLEYITTLMKTDPAKRRILESTQPPEALGPSLELLSALTAGTTTTKLQRTRKTGSLFEHDGGHDSPDDIHEEGEFRGRRSSRIDGTHGHSSQGSRRAKQANNVPLPPPVMDISDLWVIVGACVFTHALQANGMQVPQRSGSTLAVSALVSHRLALSHNTVSTFKNEQTKSLRKCPKYLLSKALGLEMESAEIVESEESDGSNPVSPLRPRVKTKSRLKTANSKKDEGRGALVVQLFGLELSQMAPHEGTILDYATAFAHLLCEGTTVQLTPEELIIQIESVREREKHCHPGEVYTIATKTLRAKVRSAAKKAPENFPKLLTEMNLHKLPSEDTRLTFNSFWIALFGVQTNRILRRVALRLERELRGGEDIKKRSTTAKELSPESLTELYEIFKLHAKSAGVLTMTQFRDLVPSSSMRPDEVDTVFEGVSTGGLMSFAQFIELLKSSYAPFNTERSEARRKGKGVDEKVPALAQQLRRTQVCSISSRVLKLDRRRKVGVLGDRIGKLRDLQREQPLPDQESYDSEVGMTFKEVLRKAMQNHNAEHSAGGAQPSQPLAPGAEGGSS